MLCTYRKGKVLKRQPEQYHRNKTVEQIRIEDETRRARNVQEARA
jgi:hypothetical protein